MAILLMFTLRAVTLGPGEMLDWDANNLAAADVVEATGGTIVFNSSVTVANNIHLGGEVSVVTLVIFVLCDQARTSKVLRRIPREDAD